MMDPAIDPAVTKRLLEAARRGKWSDSQMGVKSTY